MLFFILLHVSAVICIIMQSAVGVLQTTVAHPANRSHTSFALGLQPIPPSTESVILGDVGLRPLVHYPILHERAFYICCNRIWMETRCKYAAGRDHCSVLLRRQLDTIKRVSRLDLRKTWKALKRFNLTTLKVECILFIGLRGKTRVIHTNKSTLSDLRR